jgi:hypothetical protein
MKPTSLLLLAAAATLALGACKKAEDQPKAAAGGELLPRSVSDDMLPYDTVRSQASLAPPPAATYDGPLHAEAPDVAASAVPEDEAVVLPPPPVVAVPAPAAP